jgi:hypothetical protein
LIIWGRVTRCVCEKVAQNVAQDISCENEYKTFTLEKAAQLLVLGISVIFTETTQSKQSPNRRKFAQSGHSGGHPKTSS